MALTTTRVAADRRIDRHSDASTANAPLTVTVQGQAGRRLVQVLVKYSAAPTQAGVTTEMDSGAGAAYDTTLNTGAANAQSTVYNPGGTIIIGSDDAIRVTAPAGGAGITSQISVYTEDA